MTQKTFKTIKHMNLDELTQHCLENVIVGEKFISDRKTVVFTNINAEVRLYNNVHKNETFEVEVEEEITKNTEFDLIVKVLKGAVCELVESAYNKTINNILEDKKIVYPVIQIYAFINNKLELIWECEEQ